MATTDDEFMPDAAILDQLILDFIQPRLRSFDSEGISHLIADVGVWVRDDLVEHFVISSAASRILGVETNGEIRLRFRRTFKNTRHLWRIESIFPSISPDTGFTGFDAGGDVKLNDSSIVIRPQNWIGKYSIREWHGWS